MALPIIGAVFWNTLRTVLWGLVLSLIEPIFSRILIALGVGFFSYTGVSALLGSLNTRIAGMLGGVPADVFQILALAGFGNALTIIISGCTIKATLMGMNQAGSIVKTSFGGKGKK